MKINTHKGLFYTFAIIWGIPFILIEAILIAFAYNVSFTFDILFYMLISIAVYICIVLICYWLSYIDKCYVMMDNQAMTVLSLGAKQAITVQYCDIVHITYYSLFSWKSWLMTLNSFVGTPLAFLTYSDNGEIKTIMLGYITKKQLEQIRTKCNCKIQF